MTRTTIAPHAAAARPVSSRPPLRLLPPVGSRDVDIEPEPFHHSVGPSRSVGGAAVAIATLGVVAARTALRRRRARREVEASRNRAFADLLTAVRKRDEALAQASHDLKTPLTALKGQAQLLQRLLRTAETPDADRFYAGLAAIDAAATRAAARVDSLIGETAAEASSTRRGR